MEQPEYAKTNGIADAEFQNNTLFAGGNINLTVSGTAASPAVPAKPAAGLTDWLSSVNYKPRQVDIFSKVTSGTGHWFLESKEYKTLLGKKAVTICGTGIPGAGKTYLSSIVIDDLKTRFKKTRKAAILYVYCRYSELYSVADILGALLRQLAESNGATSNYIQKHFHLVHLRDRTTPSEVDFARMLKQTIATLKRTFILVDALDELKDDIRHGLLKHLQGITASILLTSRPSHALERIPSVVMFKIIPPKEDFQLYILQSIRDHPGLSGLLHDQEELKEDVVRVITERANGMYMLAALQINSIKLEGVLTVKTLKQALKTLPDNLDDMYSDTLERIRNQNPEKSALAKRVLCWVLYNQSGGALAFEQLSEAVTLTPDMIALPKDEKPTRDDVITSCCGLIRVEYDRFSRSFDVHLTHYTTREFLDRQLEQFLDSTLISMHTNLTLTCLKYLDLSGALACRDIAEWQNLHWSLTFSRYAFNNWHRHALLCRGSTGLLPVVNDFVRHLSSYPVANWRIMESNRNLEFLGPIHAAVRFGFVELAKELVHSADQRTNQGNTPLHFACMPRLKDHRPSDEAIAWFLLDRSTVDINARNIDGRTALHLACSFTTPEIVRLLVTHEQIDVNSRDSFGTTPLASAVIRLGVRYDDREEAREILKLLLEKPSINLNILDKAGSSVLHAAVYWSCLNVDAIRILLEHGADSRINMKDGYGRTALDLAILSSLNRHHSASSRAHYRLIADMLRAHGGHSQSLALIPSIIRQNLPLGPTYWLMRLRRAYERRCLEKSLKNLI